MFQISSGHKDGLHAKVVLMKEFQELCPVHLGDGLESAKDGEPQGMPGPKGLGKEVVDVFIRSILDHADLLDNNLPFFLQFLGGKERVEKKVKQEVQSDWKVAG